jgi:iron(III) transport system substrate-binding protein
MRARRMPGSFRHLAALALAVPLGVCCGCGNEPPPQPKRAAQLVILTPHNETIRETFAEAFWNWHMDNRGAPVRITWIYRGTPQCVEYVRASRAAQPAGGRYVDADVMFGGGIADHAALAKLGFCRSLELDRELEHIPPTLHGLPTRDPDKRWFATGLSSFGMLYNEQACGWRGKDPPKTWADLADPRFMGWLAVADPSGSGSHRECLALILQTQGWDAGWPMVMKILGNTRALNARSGEALSQVEQRVSLATFAVNFDGMSRAARSGGTLKYIDPAGATIFSPDIVSVLSTGRNAEVAMDFVRYLLSEEGQALWAVKREHRPDPYGATLYHYAILPQIYERDARELAVTHNPLGPEGERTAATFDPAGTDWQARLLNPLVRAACRDENHVRLQRLWQALNEKGVSDDVRAAGLAELTAPPFDEQQAVEYAQRLTTLSADQTDDLVQEWSAQFAERYARVAEMLK